MSGNKRRARKRSEKVAADKNAHESCSGSGSGSISGNINSSYLSFLSAKTATSKRFKVHHNLQIGGAPDSLQWPLWLMSFVVANQFHIE